MSAKKSKKQYFLLPLIAVLLIGAIALLKPSEVENSVSSESASASVVTGAFSAVSSALPKPKQAEKEHPADCAHCNTVSAAEKVQSAPPVLSTQPRFDPIFKGIAAEKKFLSQSDLDFYDGKQLGDVASVSIFGQNFSGRISVVRQNGPTKTYGLKCPEGDLLVTLRDGEMLSGTFFLNGDSRVVQIEKSAREFAEQASGSPQLEQFVASETSLSDLLCAPIGTVYPLNGPQPASVSGLEPSYTAKVFLPPIAEASPVILDSSSSAATDHVLYLDFDGEFVEDDAWNLFTGGEPVDALPAPRVNEDDYVRAIWERVVEDFAPFNIRITTDRSVYDAAGPANPADLDNKRLHVIITPTRDVSPNAGGVALRGSYRDTTSSIQTRIVWVFLLDEYDSASTISHESGHAFGLSHDGPGPQPGAEYYGGHNTGYNPGWAPIMGAPWNDVGLTLLDEVDQWSRGEYTNANNQEDDVAIIAGNGFGFIDDDYANAYNTGGAGAPVGILGSTGLNQVGATGVISRAIDVDVFQFTAAYTGDIKLTVYPFDVESTDPQPGSDTQGANLAVGIRLLDALGNVVATGVDTGDALLASEIAINVNAGTYYLEVDGVGRGNNGSVGFTDYASLGQYTVVGDMPTPPLAVFGSAPDRDEVTGQITGPGKLDQPVLSGDTATQVRNGTDYGFSFPGNASIIHTFELYNTSSTDITNMVVSLASGQDFVVLDQVKNGTLPGNNQSYKIRIAYAPQDAGINGIDNDTVRISYDAAITETFEFTVGGLSTVSADRDNYLGSAGYDNDIEPESENLNSVEGVWLSDYKGPAFFRAAEYGFFTFSAANNELVTVEVSYDPADGPITFELTNDYGILLGTTTATDGLIQYRVAANEPDPRWKILYIRASNEADGSVYNAYDLRWNSIPLVAGGDDLYEENDTQDQAFDLTGAFSDRLSEYLGEGISNDEDWYKIDVPNDPFNRMLYVRAEFLNETDPSTGELGGNIDIEVVDENGNRFFNFFNTVSATDNDFEVVTYFDTVATEDFAENFDPEGNTVIMGVPPGTYYIRVYGDFAGNSYDMVVRTLSDDRYEVVDEEGRTNDTQVTPFDLGDSVTETFLSRVDGIGTCSGYVAGSTQENFRNDSNDDWYRISFPEGVVVEQFSIEYFSYAGGIMEFDVYNSSGLRVGSNRLVNGNTTTIFSQGILDSIEALDTEYLIKVSPFTDISNLSAYDFRVVLDVEPPIVDGAVDDNYEENDNFLQLYDLSGNEGFWLAAVDGYGVHLDSDWYKITVPTGATQLNVECVFNSSLGNIDIALARKDGPILFLSEGSGSTESITWDNPEPGEYSIEVFGQERGNNYNLYWDVVLEDDNYEENDELENSFDLTGHEKQLLSKFELPSELYGGFGIQKDEDWYKIEVTSAVAELRVDMTFTHADGDIDLELYNADGFTLDRSTSTTNNESIAITNPAVGEYFVRIYYGNAGNEYDLTWGAYTQSEINNLVPDVYEVDNNSSIATLLPDQTSLDELNELATQTDEDWFEIEISETSLGFNVYCTFIHAEGDIDIEIVDSFGSVIVREDSITDNEEVDYNASLPGGTYYIRVYGSNRGNVYNLKWLDLSEDIYEENDFKDDAYDITPFKDSLLSNEGVPTQGDDDWYRVEVGQDNSFLSVELSYVHANGNIDLELYDSTGVLVPGSTSATVGDNESFFLQLSAGDYFIKVFGADAYNDYDLEWNVFEDDIYEENDFDTGAENISTLAGTVLSATQFDDDWFSVEIVDPNATFFVNLAFIHADGNIDLEIYDEIGALAPIASATSTDDNEAISFQPSVAGTYYIKVFGDDRNIAYTLVWNSILDDGFEDNDTFVQSTDTSLIVAQALDAVQLDDDWFQIDVPAGDVRLDILLEFLHADGDLGFEIYDSGEVLLNTVNSSTDNESITFGPDPVGASYFIKVFGPNTGTDYTLSWTSSTRDSYEGEEDGEGNNVIGDAFDLTDTESRFLQDVGGLATLYDEDWYAITHTQSDLLVEALFSHANGNIDIEVFNPGGLRIGGSTSDTDDVERIELFNIPTGIYYIRVFGDTSSGNPYDLIWNSFDEDNLETSVEFDLLLENDTHSEATDIMERELILESDLTQLDDDWYIIAVAGSDDTLTVRVEFEHLFGNIDLELYDETEVFVPGASSLSITDNESLTISGLSPGNYYLRVFGRNVANSYSLRWNAFSEDNYEDNDDSNIALATAADLSDEFAANESMDPRKDTRLSDISGGGVQLDDDWYRVDRTDPGRLFVFVSLSYTASHGNLDLEVYNEELELVGSSTSTNNSPEVVFFSDLGPETYYIRVFGDDFGIPYDLVMRAVPDDPYEENDNTGDAFEWDEPPGLSMEGIYGDRGIQRDPDYYRVEVPAGFLRLQAIASFAHNEGNLSLEILDSAGESLGSINSATDDENLTVIVSEFASEYFILVDGPNLGTSYDLVWNFDNTDNYEGNVGNNTSLDAFELNSLSGDPLVPTSGIRNLEGPQGRGPATLTDEDWYKVYVEADKLVLDTKLSFIHANGNIDIEIYDIDLNLLGTADTLDDEEILSVTVNQDADLNADPPEHNQYFIRVFGDDAGNRYNLEWSVREKDIYELPEDVRFTPDGAVDNDFIEDAFDLTDQEGIPLSDGLGKGEQSDDDWFIIVVSDGSTQLTVETTFTHDDGDNQTSNDGDINVDLYQIVPADPAEVDNPSIDQRRPILVFRASSENDDETITYGNGIDPVDAGLYYLRVYFQNAGNRYDLRWDDGIVDVAGDATYTDDIGQFVFTNPNPAAAPANFASNPDGDIFPNWAEYALALDANSPDQLQISQQIEEIGGEEYYTISFLRSKEAAARNFQYVVEESTNLIFDGTEAVYVRTENVSADIERVVYRCNRPRSEVPACFFRVTVNEPVSGY